MKLSGTVEIAAPRDRTWAFVTDPRQVGRCGPGVESVEMRDATHFTARASVGVAFFRARFDVELSMTEQVPPDRAVIQAHGQAPGSSVDATAEIRLSGPAAGPTRLDWTADVELSGAFANAGSRMISGMADKMAGQTFDCMRRTLEA